MQQVNNSNSNGLGRRPGSLHPTQGGGVVVKHMIVLVQPPKGF